MARTLARLPTHTRTLELSYERLQVSRNSPAEAETQCSLTLIGIKREEAPSAPVRPSFPFPSTLSNMLITLQVIRLSMYICVYVLARVCVCVCALQCVCSFIFVGISTRYQLVGNSARHISRQNHPSGVTSVFVPKPLL